MHFSLRQLNLDPMHSILYKYLQLNMVYIYGISIEQTATFKNKLTCHPLEDSVVLSIWVSLLVSELLFQ